MPRSEFLRAIHPEVSGRIRTMTTQDAEDWFAAVKGLETAAAVVAIREFFQAWDWSKFPHSIDFQVWHDAQLRARATAEGAKVHKIDGDWPAFPRCRKARVTFKAGGRVLYGWVERRALGDELYVWRRASTGLGVGAQWYRFEIPWTLWGDLTVESMDETKDWPWAPQGQAPEGLESMLLQDQGVATLDPLPDLAPESAPF
jgi:hypothetical protein